MSEEQEIRFSLQDPLICYMSSRFSHSWRGNWHSHPGWQMSASLEGVIAFKLRNGDTSFYEPGQIAFIPPGIPHLPTWETDTGRFAQIFFRHFATDIFPEPARRFNVPSDEIYSVKTELESLTDLVNVIIMRCKTSAPLCASWRLLLSNAFLLQGAESLCEQHESTQKTKLPKVIPKAMDYFEKHYQEEIAVEDVARHVGLSISRFSALFRKSAKSSPLQYLNLLRLGKAQIMLLNDSSIKEAASQNGFHSVEYFCRFFKKETGKTPSEFKKAPFNS